MGMGTEMMAGIWWVQTKKKYAMKVVYMGHDTKIPVVVERFFSEILSLNFPPG